jgi:hypothetical protein
VVSWKSVSRSNKLEREIEFCGKQCNFEKPDLEESKAPEQQITKTFLKQKPQQSGDKPDVQNIDNNNNSDDLNSAITQSLNNNPEAKEQSNEIQQLKVQMRVLQEKLAEVNQKKDQNLEKKIEELNKSKQESVKVDKQFLNELSSMKLSAKQLNSTEIFPHFLNSSRFKELNFVYFKLIDSLCLARYFKSKELYNVGCKETLCSDYCSDSPNLVNDKCFKDCSMFTAQSKKEDLYQFIIKRHAYYEAKLDVIDDKISVDFDKTKIELNVKNGTNSSIRNVTINVSEEERINTLIRGKKAEIEKIKNQMINEEANLLGLYRLKRNK